jgi:hypothetical protein
MGIRLGFSKKEWIYPLAILILGFSYYISYFNYGISLSDEGFFVYGAERVLQGQLPMSDFISYPPGSYLLLGLLFKGFGVNLQVSRYLEMAFLLMNGLMMFSIGKRLMPKTIALIPSFMLIAFPGPWHKVFFTFGLLLPLLALFRFMERRTTGRILMIGGAVGIALIFKFESALYSFLAILVILFGVHTLEAGDMLMNRDRIGHFFRDIALCSLASLTLLIPVLLVYLFQSSLIRLYLGIKEIYGGTNIVATSESFGQPSLLRAATKFHIGGLSHLFFYLIILLYLCMFVKVIFHFFIQKRRDFPLYLPILIMGCLSLTYAYAVFEKAHLLQSVAMAYLLFGYVIYMLLQKKGARSKVMLIFLISLLGLYLLDNFKWRAHFYSGSISRLVAIRREGAKKVSSAKANICVGKKESDTIHGLIHFFEGKNGYLMPLRFDPMVNFLTDLENPTRFSILYPTFISDPSRQRQVIDEVEKYGIKYLLIKRVFWTSQESAGFRNYAPIIYEFVRERYHLEKEIEDYLIFSRRS